MRLAGVPNPYPIPIVQPAHVRYVAYQIKTEGFLTEKQFANLYDRLGKHLHADNPWGADKQRGQLGQLLPTVIERAEGLLEYHVRFVQTEGVWRALVTTASADDVTVLVADADGPFDVQDE